MQRDGRVCHEGRDGRLYAKELKTAARPVEALDGTPASPIQHEKAMALQFLVGGIVSVVNIMIHALVTVGAVGIARSAGLRHTGGRDCT